MILHEGKMDAGKILRLIQHDRKEDFPYLGGPKLSNYWLYILNIYTDAKIKNTNMISIIPDTHVIQASVRLGVVENTATPQEVARAWHILLEGSNIRQIDMHPVLWHWSRGGFLPEIQ